VTGNAPDSRHNANGSNAGGNGEAHDESALPLETNDSALDPDQLAADNEALRRKVADLDARLRTADEQVRHYANAYDKARGEFNAAKDRIARENERNVRRDQVKLVSGLLTVLDSLDRSLQSLNGGEVPGQGFVDGVRLIRLQFERTLQGLGLERFDGVGEVFDPARHQAVASLPVAEPAQDGKVIQGLSAGARIGDEVVRPATVIVGKFVADDETQTVH
jgi:molecular chaperone GrpE